MGFSKRLKELRESKKWTQQYLGDLINATDVTISRYEKGQREPDLDTLNEFAKIFDVSIDYLLGKDQSSNVSENAGSYETLDIFKFNNEELKVVKELADSLEGLSSEERQQRLEKIKLALKLIEKI